jgi:hemolysin activation/secretion protein
VRLSGTAEVRPIKGVLLSLSPRFQWSSDALFAFESFAAGNYTVGRGYEPGSLSGDRGAGFQAEIRSNAFRLNLTSQIGFQPYLFTDFAWAWNKRNSSTPANTRNPARLSSVGGGVRVSFANHAQLDLTLAAPTRTLPGETRRRDVRLLASLTTSLIPWRTR